MLIISVIKFQDFRKFPDRNFRIFVFTKNVPTFDSIKKNKFGKKINGRTAMKFNPKNKNIWGNAMRVFGVKVTLESIY